MATSSSATRAASALVWESPVPLPVVAAPSLEGLKVAIPTPPDLTSDDVLQRLVAASRAKAPRRDRRDGERLEAGDDVQLDCVGYAKGALLPFSTRFEQWVELAPMPDFPGLAEVLLQGRVGETLKAELVLPRTHPVPSLRDVTAHFVITVRRAREVTMGDESAEALVARLGIAPTLDETLVVLRGEVEQSVADRLTLEAQNRVLDELVRRAGPEVPETLVDEEVRRSWHQLEGAGLERHGFTSGERAEALAGWLSDERTRHDARRRLAIGLTLRTIVDQQRLSLTPAACEVLLSRYAAPFDYSLADVQASLRAGATLTGPLLALAWHLHAVEHVMKHVRFEVLPSRGAAS